MLHPSANKSKRTAAGIMGLMMLFFVLFSALFIVVEADHECTGEDCPICLCIEQCEELMRQIGTGIKVMAMAVIISLGVLSAVCQCTDRVPLGTLVTEKVRLNN
ncbi:MAG: hypothetical protein K6A77_08250 [Clostridiales bacterium]|nr:hypothetical protein [Clostridiales bacterium]